MNRDRPKPDTAPASKPSDPRVKSGRFWVAILLLITLGCVWGVWKKSRQPGGSAESNTEPKQTASGQQNSPTAPPAAPTKVEDQALEPVEVSTTQTRAAPNPGTVLAIPERRVPAAQPAPPRPEPAPYTRQLVP